MDHDKGVGGEAIRTHRRRRQRSKVPDSSRNDGDSQAPEGHAAGSVEGALKEAPSDCPSGDYFTSDSETGDAPDRCSLCRHQLGRERPGNREVELKAYLPCGHSFGHICLFGLIFAFKKRDLCPAKGCMIPLRHSCGHLTIPSITKPELLFQNTDADLIPAPCPYCAELTGQRKHERLKKWTIKYHCAANHAETASALAKPWALMKRGFILQQVHRIQWQLDVGHNARNLVVWDKFRVMAKYPQLRPQARASSYPPTEHHEGAEAHANAPKSPPSPVMGALWLRYDGEKFFSSAWEVDRYGRTSMVRKLRKIDRVSTLEN